jgi:hypothetical protein
MGSSTNTTTQLSSSSLPANVSAGLGTAVDKAISASNAANPLQGWTQPTAPWGNPAQMTATNLTTQAATYQPQQVGTEFQPYMVGSGYTPQTVTPSSVTQFGSPTVSGSDIAAMQNPWTQQVVQTSLDELNRQLARTNQAASGQAASAGAFGGDRAAIVQAENARNANQIAAQTTAGLNSQGFTTAAQIAQQNASRQLQAGTAQGQLDANVGEANQYAGLQGANLAAQQERANQAAYAQAQALKAQQERSNQQAGLSGAQLNLSGAGQLGTFGNQYQQTQQNDLDRQWTGATQNAMWPFTQTNQLIANMGTLAGASPRTVASSQTTPGPSTAGQLAGLGTAAVGLNSLLPGGIAGQVKGLFGSSGGSTIPGDQLNSGFNVSGFDPAGGFDAGFGSAPDLSMGSGDFTFDVARGGLVGYAPGGRIHDMQQGDDGTYVAVDPDYLENRNGTHVAVDQDYLDNRNGTLPLGRQPVLSATAYAPPWAKRPVSYVGDNSVPNLPAQPAGAAPQPGLAPAVPPAMAAPQPDTHLQQDYSTYSPAPGGVGANGKVYQANLDRGTPVPAVTADDQDMMDVMAQPGFGSTLVDREIATDPAQIVEHGATPQQAPPAPQAADHTAAPVPIMTNSESAAPGLAPNRITQSANPSAPMPPGYSGPQQNDWSHNQVGMALLSAGLGMMASRSPHALSAIGEGGLAGVQQLNQMRKQETDAALKAQLYGVKGAAVGVQQQRADDYGRSVDNRATAAGNKDELDRAKLAEQARKNDMWFKSRLDRNGHLTGAELQKQLIDQYVKEHDGATTTEAYAALKNYTAKNSQAEQRLGIQQQNADQGAQRIANMQEWRAFQQQSKATDQEISAARSVQFNATNMGKQMTMGQALNQVRGARESAGPAPIVGNPISTAAGGQSAPAQGGDMLAKARAAIARGAPREAVAKRLQEAGYDPAGL